VRGTTAEATLEPGEPFSSCGATKNSVWYAFEADDSRPIVVAPDPPARLPGERLPRSSAAAVVDRLANPDDAWSIRLREGRTYRMNFVTQGVGCASVELYDADARSFGDQAPERTLRCDAHTVYAPSSSGVHSLLVRAPRASRSRLPTG
jgi:hypothetical protein